MPNFAQMMLQVRGGGQRKSVFRPNSVGDVGVIDQIADGGSAILTDPGHGDWGFRIGESGSVISLRGI